MEMSMSRFFSALAMVVATIVAVAYGAAYLQIRERDRMASELAQWHLEEWKQSYLNERRNEFAGGNQ